MQTRFTFDLVTNLIFRHSSVRVLWMRGILTFGFKLGPGYIAFAPGPNDDSSDSSIMTLSRVIHARPQAKQYVRK
jgi:hypothetical protein